MMDAAAVLQQGLHTLSITLTAEKQKRLLAFGQLLLKWNRVYNLTSVRLPEEVLSRHLLDALSVLPHLQGIRRLADVGSGGGLPGIPLAVACPEMHVTSIETVNKKASFQMQARIELGLENLEVLNTRVEQITGVEPFDGIISRAFSSLADFVALAGSLAGMDGRLYAMKGIYPADEIAALPAGWKVAEEIMLEVPGLDAERHLIVLVRA